VEPFKFGTKGRTLERLKTLVVHSTIPELVCFSVSEWENEKDEISSNIASHFGCNNVAIRSSAQDEDGRSQALAGKYDSVLRVNPQDSLAVSEAVINVIRSYKRDLEASPSDQIIVQTMVSKVVASGVVLTLDLTTGAPYYVINYDDETGRTDTVTSGGEYSNRTLYVQRGEADSLRSPRWRALVKAVAEIEKKTQQDSLDIEFAIDEAMQVHILQVRPITTTRNWSRDIALRVNDTVAQIKNHITNAMLPDSALMGESTIFGQMPDWNPVEMIGRAPRRLALSLYRKLITDRVWRLARARMGYNHPKDVNLMHSLGGQPFIDVRASFNSFLPADLPRSIGAKLIDAWIIKLKENPHLHDKVEFDVALPNYVFDFDKRVEILIPGILTEEEKRVFKKSLKRLTLGLVEGRVEKISENLERICLLDSRRSESANLANSLSSVDALLSDCVEMGTIPFSIIARHAFIAQDLLSSMIRLGVLPPEEAENLQNSLTTVAGSLTDDMHKVAKGILELAEFMVRFGHLRPGTYDILSSRYDERDDLNFDSSTPTATADFNLSEKTSEKIKALLKEEGFCISVENFVEYIRQAITAREHAKFVFTRNISDALKIIAQWGQEIGLSREELSHLEIDKILGSRNTIAGSENEVKLRLCAEEAAKGHDITHALRLPELLVDVEGVHIIPLRLNQPNFISTQSITAQCVRVTAQAERDISLKNKIVLIKSADPGYDWIFGHRIGGLITQYGGANSHMAVRCAEFGIPAAVGCGEQIFNRIEQVGAAELNCLEGYIRAQ